MNRVEILLECLIKHFRKKYEKKPDGGIKVEGKIKMSYKDIVDALETLRIFLLQWCEMECYNVCEECEYYVENSTHFGRCHNPDRDKAAAIHKFHTCWRNTATRWDGKKFNYQDYPSQRGKK